MKKVTKKNKSFKPIYRSYKVVLSDGSTFTGKWSFFKRTYDSITDSVNHPVWNSLKETPGTNSNINNT